MAKASVIQRSFSLGETRDEFLERDDLDVRRQSSRRIENARILSTEAAENRPGTYFVVEQANVRQQFDFRPETDVEQSILIFDDKIIVMNEDGSVRSNIDFGAFPEPPWTDGTQVWFAVFGNEVIFGGNGLWVLAYTRSAADVITIAFGALAFANKPGAEVAQPYWAFNPGVSIQPNGYSGSVTVAASDDVFVPAHVGKRIRYIGKEIEITAYTSATEVTGTVIRDLPPSFDIDVASSSGFAIGESLVSSDTNWQGAIVGISGNTLECVTTNNYEAPSTIETISGPNKSTAVVAANAVGVPYGTFIWDEPLISSIHGYPASGAAVNGRLCLVNFPKIPDLVALSSSRNVNDFDVGADDDDAIVRQSGDEGQRFLHAVASSDLIILSDAGCYYVKTRDNTLLTPSNFQTVRFDERSANTVRPALVDDAVVFVEGSGQTVSAAVLRGNVYLDWKVAPLSRLHNHLIKSPVRLCGPALRSDVTEKYMIIVNEDGSAAAMSWVTEFGEDAVGFVPWTTQGTIIDVSPVFGGYWAIVDREIDGSTKRYMERFDQSAMMDCVRSSEPYADHLIGRTVGIWSEDWYAGQRVVGPGGEIEDFPVLATETQVGLEFATTIAPWPIEIVEGPRIGMVPARLVRVSVSVQDTVTFKIRRNNTDVEIEAYNVGDDLSLPPARKEKVYRAIVFGNRDHPEVEIIRDQPGPFRVLSVGQEVSY